MGTSFFSQGYVPPGSYSQVSYESAAPTFSGATRIPVLIGEGQESFSYTNVEVFRGSSAVADVQVVDENISTQVNGTNTSFQLSHYPVTDGTGSGATTNDPTKISVFADTGTGPQPVTVLSLNGTAGTFVTASIIPDGANATVNYYFHRGDTQVTNEDDSYQIPAFATLEVDSATGFVLSLTVPGAVGNEVTFALTLASNGNGVSDAQAVSGAGTNAISIELLKTDNSTRTYTDIQNLITAGIPTLSAGYITVKTFTVTGSTSGTAMTAKNFSGGSGQNTNTTYTTQFGPIVDGSGGGVTTTDITKVTALVNGVAATVAAVDGANRQITLASGVAYGSTLEFTYWYNTWQNTSDILPTEAVSTITEVGLAPNRADYIQGTDYLLSGTNQITWGAAATIAAGSITGGYSSLEPDVSATVVDERVYLRLCTGSVNGVNQTYTLPDAATDGSGTNRTTNNPSLIKVYTGVDPQSAYQAGAVTVLNLNGASGTFELKNPPASGNVYASYYRNTINTHTWTVKVGTPGIPGQGSYTLTNENSLIAPHVALTASSVADTNYTSVGIVWPSSFSDLQAGIGAVDEVVTLTFQNDSLTYVVTPAVQANAVFQGMTLTATTTGTGPNNKTNISVLSGTAQTGMNQAFVGSALPAWTANDTLAVGYKIADSSGNVQTVTTAGTTGSSVPTWNTTQGSGTTTDGTVTWTCGYTAAESAFVYLGTGLTVAQIITLVNTTYPLTTTLAGVLTLTANTGTSTTTAVTAQAITFLTGGAAAVTSPYADRFTVASSLSSGGSAGTGYLGQTYIDAVTALKFTLVQPSQALGWGYTTAPTPTYYFAPNDTLQFTVSKTTAWTSGATPIVAVPGVRTTVSTTYGTKGGDTAVLTTFRGSGTAPSVGEYYYVSFTQDKPASAYGTGTDNPAIQIFSDPNKAYALFGDPTVATNRLSVAISLAYAAGAKIIGAVQVQKQSGLNTASDLAFQNAIQGLAQPLPGYEPQHANIIVPLSTSTTVQQALSRFTITQSAPRQRAECVAVVGFGQFANATYQAAQAKSLANSRVIAVGGSLAGINLPNATTGIQVETPLTGEFLAAAVAGLMVNPANDVATTLTGQSVVGFTRMLQTFDEPTMNMMAAAGLTVLYNDGGAIKIRHYKTTDPTNDLTSEPTSVLIGDDLAQSERTVTKQFVGRKRTQSLLNQIQLVVATMLQQKLAAGLIDKVTGVTVTADKTSASTVDVQFSAKPVFSTLWINSRIRFTLNP